MVQHSFEENPNECCGILSGKNDEIHKLYKIKNSAASPYRYLMDPEDIYKAMKDSDNYDLDFMIFYHSHTHTLAFPSDTDRRMALESGWVNFCYAVVSLEDENNPIVKFYIIDSEGNVENIEVMIK
jgi:proteasome lid subunit RPN8/RPN11|tara:strand:+ start:645 stop:1022 length:378 start_codon:yes stop_codon:yes gene_type:complete